jgi:exonuclease SbcC
VPRFIEEYNQKDFGEKLSGFQNIQDSKLEADLERLKKNYLLFNYISQEEATYFLKKNQNDRKEGINILTSTDDSGMKAKQLEDIDKLLKDLCRKLEPEIKKNKTESIKQSPYERLLKKELNFDKENPFTDHKTLDMTLQAYLEETETLKILIKTFKPSEYQKYLSQKDLTELAENETFLSYLILKPILDLDLVKNTFPKLQKLKDEQISYYILNDLFLKCSELESYNQDLELIREFLEKPLNEQQSNLENFLNSISDTQIRERVDKEAFIQKYTELKSLRQTASKGDAALNKLIDLRNQLLKHSQADSHPEAVDDSCPLCGFDWSSESSLISEFEKITKKLKDQQSDLAQQLGSRTRQLNEEYINPLTEHLGTYKDKKPIDEELLKTLREDATLSKFNEEILNDFSDLKWDLKKIYSNDYKKLNEDIKSFREKIYQKNNYSNETYKLLQSLQGESFKEALKKINALIKRSYLSESFGIKYQITQISDLIPDLHVFKQKLTDIKSLLEDASKEIIIENHSVTGDLIRNFDKFFDKNIDDFQSVISEQITSKENYLSYQASQLKTGIHQKLSDRQNKINKIKEQIKYLGDIYFEQTKKFKAALIQDLKIPFHIFSARILQNYNQGMGIFLVNDEDKIVFSSINRKDHDVTRKLSSGQLAVTSIAFFLSMNKVYRNFNLLNLLAIDDPIQDLDAINIHTFIELLRHEFAGEYQLLIATHDDMNARYMKYKLEKYVKNQEVKQINVQDLFFN